MAVINNLSATLKSFTINGKESALANVIGAYGTADILNGGETYLDKSSNTLIYTFSIKGLQSHTIKNIIVRSLLLNSDGSLASTKRFTLQLNTISNQSDLVASELVKTVIPTAFAYIEEQTTNELLLSLSVTNNSQTSCYYGLYSLLINLQDINYSIQVTFTGPTSNRSSSNIIAAPLLINRDSTPITFSKDPTIEYSKDTSVDGRLYLNKNGIFVDGYQYGVNVSATTVVKGVVTLQDSFDKNDSGTINAPTNSGVAASPQLVYEAVTIAQQNLQNALKGVQAPIKLQEGDNLISLQDGFTLSDDFCKGDNDNIELSWITVN